MAFPTEASRTSSDGDEGKVLSFSGEGTEAGEQTDEGTTDQAEADEQEGSEHAGDEGAEDEEIPVFGADDDDEFTLEDPDGDDDEELDADAGAQDESDEQGRGKQLTQETLRARLAGQKERYETRIAGLEGENRVLREQAEAPNPFETLLAEAYEGEANPTGAFQWDKRFMDAFEAMCKDDPQMRGAWDKVKAKMGAAPVQTESTSVERGEPKSANQGGESQPDAESVFLAKQFKTEQVSSYLDKHQVKTEHREALRLQMESELAEVPAQKVTPEKIVAAAKGALRTLNLKASQVQGSTKRKAARIPTGGGRTSAGRSSSGRGGDDGGDGGNTGGDKDADKTPKTYKEWRAARNEEAKQLMFGGEGRA